MRKSHFFDIDTILDVNCKVWIVDKGNPGSPIMKISESDFNLVKSGIYKSQRCDIKVGSKTYWFSEDLLSELKAKCKKLNRDISKVAFSMQEYMNRDVIDTLDYDINIENIRHLKNTSDDIYIICSKNTKTNYERIIKKIESLLKESGLSIKKYYFVSETFYSRDQDAISRKKVALLLEHLIGLKVEDDRFVQDEAEKYDEVGFYDDEPVSIKLAKECNSLLNFLLENSDSQTKLRVKEILKAGEHILCVNEVSHNKVNKFSSSRVKLEQDRIIKTFEMFSARKYPKI